MTNSNPQGRHLPLSAFKESIQSDMAIWRQDEWGDMRIGYETYLLDFEDKELLIGLPDDRCQCPHYGYLLSGRLIFRYSDHEEEILAGEVYYAAPGHTMFAEAGTVLIEFSPKEQFRELTEIAEKNFEKMTEKGR